VSQLLRAAGLDPLRERVLPSIGARP